MSKKRFMAFMAITLSVLAVSIFIIVYIMNLPAKVGVMTAQSGSQTITPVSNITEYNLPNKKETLRPLELVDINDTLPILDCTVSGLTTNYTEDAFDNYRFTLYDENLNEVYEGRGTFTEPEKAGVYTVKVEFSWGSSKNNYIRTEQFFKVKY